MVSFHYECIGQDMAAKETITAGFGSTLGLNCILLYDSLQLEIQLCYCQISQELHFSQTVREVGLATSRMFNKHYTKWSHRRLQTSGIKLQPRGTIVSCQHGKIAMIYYAAVPTSKKEGVNTNLGLPPVPLRLAQFSFVSIFVLCCNKNAQDCLVAYSTCETHSVLNSFWPKQTAMS